MVMFDQVTIRVADRSASERFYRTTLGAIGVEPTRAVADGTEWDEFRILAADAEHPPTRNLHLAFVARSRNDVDWFWRAGVDAGFEDGGGPGERPQYTPGYYGAFLLDPDGNSVEAVHHSDLRRGGNLDHLWIGVDDLAEAIAFYASLARYTGLREGRRWEGGRQFRGAWATFSLVQDGRTPTENLQIAFPAPDRLNVEDFHRSATAAGYRDHRAPCEQSGERLGRYGAGVRGPDGTIVESVFREPR